MRYELTARERKRVESALKAKRFTNITWRFDTVECSHRSHGGMNPKGITDLVRELGFYVPCGGIAGRAYCQVWVAKSSNK